MCIRDRNRVGLRPQSALAGSAPDYAVEVVRAIADKPGIRLDGVWTHLAVADELDRSETSAQLECFNRLLDAIRPEMDDEVIVHVSNSAGLLAHPDARFDMVRTGIAAYGIEPARGLGAEIDLEPAMSLTSQLSMVKPVHTGEAVSYGLTHTFATDTILGTFPMGYADGLRRDSDTRGRDVLVAGQRRPIVGTITMDQTMVDLGPESTAKPGDEVVLIGRQGEHEITVTDIAETLGTISYEIVCDIGRRVRRRYL